MKRLLDFNFVPNLRLLEHLYNQATYGTITYFSEELKMDRRTILKTIHSLQIDIDNNNWQHMITIEILEKDLVARIGPLFSIETFYSYYMSKSLCVDFIVHLFTNQSDSIEELCDRFYVSRATLYRRLTPLKTVLADFNLTLDFTEFNNQLIGSEKQIRYFYFTLFWEASLSFSSSENNSGDFENQSFQLFYKNHQLPTPFILMFELQYEISLCRINQGYVIEIFPNYELPEIYFSFFNFEKLISKRLTPFGLSSIQTKTELRALFFFITTSTSYSSQLRPKFPLNQMPWTSSIMPSVQKLITYFKEFFQLNLSDTEYAYLVVNIYFLFLKNTVLTGGSLHFGFNLLPEALVENNRKILSQVIRFFEFLETKEPEFHISRFYKLSYTLIFRRFILKAAPPLQVLIYSKVSLDEKHWLENRLVEVSSIPIQFHINWQPGLEIDLVISDFPLPLKFMPKSLDNYFLWSTFPSEFEWSTLIKLIEQKYFNRF